VVGASSGIGRATAAVLARGGASVLAVARRGDRLQELSDELEREGRTLATCTADVTRQEDVQRMGATALAGFGRIDVLVYATGTNLPERRLDVLSPEGWEHLIDTNLTGAYLCTQAVLPAMRSAGGGLIIYLSSAAVQMPDVSGVAYQASKHGLVGLAKGVRVEEKVRGIRTTIIFPGLCDTEILNRRPTPTPDDVLKKALDPHDVAEAIAFVARMPARAIVPEMHILPALLQ
jgi:NADP-dependent 3-hydroxy acid dehydrogenase YdfG